MPSRCMIWNQDTLALARHQWFLVPPGTTAPLHCLAHNSRVEILDENGKSILLLEKGSKKVKLKPGALYQLKLSTKSPSWNWSGFGGFPFILCRSKEMARKLNGGMTRLADKSYVPLKFQKRVYDWMMSLDEKDLKIAIPDLMKYKDKFAEFYPETASMVFIGGPISVARIILKSQNLDKNSPDFGSSTCRDMGALAYLYTLDRPYNPYYKNKALLLRTALYYLQKYSVSKRSYYFPLCGNGTCRDIYSNYAGGDGMVMVPGSVAFMLLAPHLKPDLRELWAEALAFPLRRFYNDRVSCENQSAHWPVKHFAYYKATGNKLFKQLAEDFVRDIANEKLNYFFKTGYLREAQGPDATYQGLCVALIAYYFHFSGNSEALAVCDKIYTLFNHTVAPDPDGTIYGASGFAHRTPGSWVQRQYGGGTALLTDKLKSAAVWHQHEKIRPLKDVLSYLSWSNKDGAVKYYTQNRYSVSYAFCPFSKFWNAIPKREVIKDAKFPVLESENFDREFNREFYFARRPSYYAGAYTGKTAGKNYYFAKNPPLRSNWKEKDGIITITDNKFFMPLPGMQLFWTPKYGMLLCSMNWSLYTQWTTRLADKDPNWPEYGSSTANYDAGKLEMGLKFRKTPLTLKRTASFGEKKLEIKLEFAGDAKGQLKIEQLPYIVKKDTKLEYHSNGKWGSQPGTCDAIRWTNGKGAGVIAEFAKPAIVKTGKILVFRGMKICCLDISIPGNNFVYTLEETQ